MVVLLCWFGGGGSLCGLVPLQVLGKVHDNIIILSDEKKLCEKGMVCFARDCGAQQRTVP